MQLTSTSHFSGPSLHSQNPVLCHVLGESEQLPDQYFDSTLLEELFEALPGLRTHWAACGGSTNPDENPVVVNHLFEHVCIELLHLTGCDVECVRSERDPHTTPNQAVVASEYPEVGIRAAELARDLLTSLLPGALPSENEGGSFHLESQLNRFFRYASRRILPIQDRELMRRARLRDVPATTLCGRILRLGQGRYQKRVSATKTSSTNVVSNDLAANKDYTHRILSDIGLPNPRYERVYKVDDAVKAAARIGYPVVVKPNNGSMGGGVSVGMKNAREVRDAFQRAREAGPSVLVTEVISGNDYRMLVVNGELLAASHRVPARVTGDGVSTVEQLVEQVNSDPRRGTGPRCSWTKIDLNDQADRLLTDLGYTRRSIPREGEIVYLRRNANTSDGGSAVDVTDIVHPDNKLIAERAARAIGLDVAGVDLLTEDISVPLWESGGCICEVNSRPGLRKHIWPAEGLPRDVTTPIIDMLFPPGAHARIPVVAVTGTGELGATARTLAHVLEDAGHHVGLATGHRVYIGGRRIGKERLTAPAAARMIFMDPDVDIAVLEISPDDVLHDGLGCDVIDVSVVVNERNQASNGQPPLTEATINALGVIARTTRELILLDGNDTECMQAIARDAGDATLCPLMSGNGSRANGSPSMVFDGTELRDQRNGEGACIRIPGHLLDDPEKSTQLNGALFASAAALGMGEDARAIEHCLPGFKLTL